MLLVSNTASMITTTILPRAPRHIYLQEYPIPGCLLKTHDPLPHTALQNVIKKKQVEQKATNDINEMKTK